MSRAGDFKGYWASIACRSIVSLARHRAMWRQVRGGDGEIRLWDLKGGKLLRTFEAHSAGVCCLSFAGDGRTLAGAADDRVVRFWDVTSGDPARVVLNHMAASKVLRFVPTSRSSPQATNRASCGYGVRRAVRKSPSWASCARKSVSLLFRRTGNGWLLGQGPTKIPRNCGSGAARYRDRTDTLRQTK